ncbi:MAG: YqeG family HAD IIIA-type phosphatase [Clostridia bacterium]|nr:YqeG family HAD IIIA-type phosphatase [Clostridia bacterium]
MSLFSPHHTFRAYYQLTPAFLREQGVRVLLLDIDNTLAPYEQPLPDERLRTWLSSLREAGIAVAFLSNNHAGRVELFNRELGLPCRYDAYKPLTRRAKRLYRSLGGTNKTTAFMGDQIFTDVCCARLAGARAYLVPPIWDKRDVGTRFKRWLEKGILKRFYKKHKDEPDVREGNPITEEIRAEMEKRKI